MSLRICWVLPAIFACAKTSAPQTRTEDILRADGGHPPPVADAAADAAGERRAAIERVFAADEKARALALTLYDETGDVADVEREQTMDGGFRGKLHIVPALPTGDDRVALERIVAAARDFDRFFSEVRATRYRWRDLSFRFFRSESGPPGHEVPRTTPSAYADGTFTLAFNLRGSLLQTERGVRETIFHEVFHMNDAAHGDWSRRALANDYAAILARCAGDGTSQTNLTACLRPYAPNDTMVRGGTFYAFQPNNGLPSAPQAPDQGNVREYAAELALRWYEENRAVLRHEPLPGGHAFKCGPAENRRSWDALVREFFAIDLVPPCP